MKFIMYHYVREDQQTFIYESPLRTLSELCAGMTNEEMLKVSKEEQFIRHRNSCVKYPDPKYFPHLKYLCIDDFRKQLDFFERAYGFVSKKDFFDSFKTGKSPEGVVLTFDDGLKDHYDYVFPELKKRGLWGIFYVPVNTGDKIWKRFRLLTPHRVHVMLRDSGGVKVLAVLQKELWLNEIQIVPEYKEKFENTTYVGLTDEDAAMEVKRIINYYLAERDRVKVTDAMMRVLFPVGFEEVLIERHYMTDKMLRKMSRNGMIIGAHTVDHPVMSKLDRGEQDHQIGSCFRYIEGLRHFWKQPRTYCHPYGGKGTYNDTTLKILEEHNCLFSLDVNPRDVTDEDLRSNRQALPRYDCNLFTHGQTR
jgi:peptidoglycan/xylan/chitin deacetylase (PgdA/CDA1 family)